MAEQKDSLHVVCPECGKVNRVLTARIGDVPKCASCKARLLPESPVVLSEGSFDTHITRSDIPVVVDFWAPWCGPCKMMAPEFEKAAGVLAPMVRLAKLDTDSAPGIAARFNISAIPTIAMFRGGKEIARQAGAMNKPQLVQWVRSNLG